MTIAQRLRYHHNKYTDTNTKQKVCCYDSPISVSVWQAHLSFHTHTHTQQEREGKQANKQKLVSDKLLIHLGCWEEKNQKIQMWPIEEKIELFKLWLD